MDRNTRTKKIVFFNKFSSEKTISAYSEDRILHKKYKKIVKKRKNYLIHIEKDVDLNKDDKIEILSIRPISKNKSWLFLNKVENK